MFRPLLIAKGLLGVAAVMGASLVASEVFAFQHGWHAALGEPWGALGRLPLYNPLAIWQWASQWAREAPGHFQTPALAGLLSIAACVWPLRKQAVPRDDVARWATTEDLQAAGLYATHGAVLGKKHGRLLRWDGPREGTEARSMF